MNEALENILSNETIIVKQDTEMANVLLSIDAANRYIIMDANGQNLGIAAEESSGVGGFLLRQLLNNNRPCNLHIYDNKGVQIATGKKPFRFIFTEMSATTDGVLIGRTRRRFNMAKRKYTIDVDGSSGFEIQSSLFQFGNIEFKVTRNNSVVAVISKKYEGLMKMAFTQADTFFITFKDKNLTLNERFTLLYTLFLIDFDVFEQKK